MNKIGFNPAQKKSMCQINPYVNTPPGGVANSQPQVSVFGSSTEPSGRGDSVSFSNGSDYERDGVADVGNYGETQQPRPTETQSGDDVPLPTKVDVGVSVLNNGDTQPAISDMGVTESTETVETKSEYTSTGLKDNSKLIEGWDLEEKEAKIKYLNDKLQNMTPNPKDVKNIPSVLRTDPLQPKNGWTEEDLQYAKALIADTSKGMEFSTVEGTHAEGSMQAKMFNVWRGVMASIDGQDSSSRKDQIGYGKNVADGKNKWLEGKNPFDKAKAQFQKPADTSEKQ